MTDRLAEAHSVLQRAVDDGQVSGAVGLVGDKDEGVVMAVGAMALGGPPMAQDTIFRITSMTKPITAAAAMMLVEDGKLSLTEPVDRLLPELADRRVLRTIDGPLDDTVPARRPITLEDLLTFTLGLGLVMAPPGAWPIQQAIAERGLMGFGPPDPTTPLGPDEWIARLGELPLMAQPGERWLYTAGSNVLGVLIARASGQPFPDFLQARVFEPLGMVDTGFFVPPEKIGRLCAAYRPTPDGLELYDAGPGGGWSRPPALPAGDAGLVSTAGDFFAFARFIANNGRAGDQRLLSVRSVREMNRNHLTPKQREGGAMILGPHRSWGYGMAVLIDDEDGLGAGAHGWNGGFGTSWTNDRESGRTAILMTQTLFGSPEQPSAHEGFARAVFRGG